jgi:hypothetical protein
MDRASAFVAEAPTFRRTVCRQEARRVQDERHLRSDVNEGGRQRVQDADRRQANAHNIATAIVPAKFCQMIRRVPMGDGERLDETDEVMPRSTTSALSSVTSVPEPIATPASASLSAGASLTPSR